MFSSTQQTNQGELWVEIALVRAKLPSRLCFDVVLPVYRPVEDLPRDAKTSTDVNHNSASAAAVTPGSHAPAKAAPPAVSTPSSAAPSSSVLSSFLYGMPMSSKPHPDGKLDFKAMSFLSLGKDRAAGWTSGTDKMSVKDCAATAAGELRVFLVSPVF